MIQIPWISPELEVWKSSKRLSVLAGLQLPAKFLSVPRQDGARHGSCCWQAASSTTLHPLSSSQLAWLQSIRTALPRRTGIPLPASSCWDRKRRRARNGHGVVDCWISWQKGRRVQAGAAERGQGPKGAEPNPIPDLDLWPASSCRDEDCGFTSAPSWQALSYCTAFLCYACSKHQQ